MILPTKRPFRGQEGDPKAGGTPIEAMFMHPSARAVMVLCKPPAVAGPQMKDTQPSFQQLPADEQTQALVDAQYTDSSSAQRRSHGRPCQAGPGEKTCRSPFRDAHYRQHLWQRVVFGN
ncbi:hypothetical protein CB1_000111009 [Camelus ferus]|nr:hypothetical protein CB1_000111009 [Camelus ferus]